MFKENQAQKLPKDGSKSAALSGSQNTPRLRRGIGLFHNTHRSSIIPDGIQNPSGRLPVIHVRKAGAYPVFCR
jgi:hypothetical protein